MHDSGWTLATMTVSQVLQAQPGEFEGGGGGGGGMCFPALYVK